MLFVKKSNDKGTKVIFIAYADGDFYLEKAKQLLPIAREEGFDPVILYQRDDLMKTDFYRMNRRLLDIERGAGYWLWKPYFILETMKQFENDDIIFYLDVGDMIQEGIKNFIIKTVRKSRGYFVVQSYHNNTTWTKRDCFVYMNCDSKAYWNTRQVEAGSCGFKKSAETMVFVNEWLAYCRDERIISDIPNQSGKENFPDFKQHRWDQSVLTNLCHKHRLKTVSFKKVSKYISYNVGQRRDHLLDWQPLL